MELNEILRRRYSCRDYNNKKVLDKDLFFILNNAVLAPNAGNLQSWRFIIVEDEDKKEEVTTACLQQRWMNKASVHIVVLSNLGYLKMHYKDRAELYAVQDSTLAVGNILLLAASLNIDTCFVSAFDEEMLRRSLKIPSNVIPHCVITLGYSNKKVEEKKRFPLNSLMFFETYGDKQDGKKIIPLKETFKKKISKIKKR